MTSHSPVTRDYPVTSRVSHATHTTPHHTMSLVTAVCGVSGYSFHPSHGDLRATPDKRMSRCAAVIGGGF